MERKTALEEHNYKRDYNFNLELIRLEDIQLNPQERSFSYESSKSDDRGLEKEIVLRHLMHVITAE